MGVKKVLVVLGTRPEAIKLAPVIKKLQAAERLKPRLAATGQHREMLAQVLELFNLEPDYNLEVMAPGQDLIDLTAVMLKQLKPILAAEKPDLVLVQGDTATTLTAALAARLNKLSVAHVEAGLRSYRRFSPYPEEINRQVVSRLTDLHLAPTAKNKANLQREGIDSRRILVTGNPVIDALQLVVSPDYAFDLPSLAELNFDRWEVILVTAHRRENWGQPLINLCRALKEVVREQKQVKIIFPVHLNPVVKNKVEAHLGGVDRVKLLKPLSYPEFVNLMARARLVVTDSGGIQEEAPGLDKPVLVVREITERQEALAAGTIKLVGTDKDQIKQTIIDLLTDPAQYRAMTGAKNPYGDGRASRRIIEGIKYFFGWRERPGEIEFKSEPRGRANN